MFIYPVLGPQAGGSGLESLLNDMVAWWTLDEGGGTRIDSHGSFDLSDSGTTPSIAGKVSSAADFSSGITTLSRAAGDVYGGSFDFSGCFWGYVPTSVPDRDVAVCNYNTDTAMSFYVQTANLANRNFQFVGRQADGAIYPYCTSTITTLPDTWYFVYYEYDHSTQTMGLKVNDETKVTTIVGGTGLQSGAEVPFRIGSRAADRHWTGYVDEAAFWTRTLTEDEIASIYNEGAGITYADL